MTEPAKHDRLMEHEYDGIAEYDNPMPGWWVFTFWLTIVFAVAYALNIGGIGTGDGRVAEYEKDMAAFRAANSAPSAGTSAEALLAIAGDREKREEGREVFTRTCAACHAADGGGIIGPNLTDDNWLHGGRIDQINATIANGVLAKGMPAWGKILKPKEVDEVTAYVWSLRGTRPARPKPPEGELVAR
ncbi:MAG: c-type cytochrome [Gemmatimonadetes bacterium]|nr:c-type cytochrome [Gemmatimonadota bacterium]